MKSIIALFWRICIFKAGPEAVPANNFFLLLVIVLNIALTSTVQYTLAEGLSLLTALTLSVVSLAGTGALIWFVMMLMNLSNRVPQTMTAVFAVDIFTTLLTTFVLLISETAGQMLTQLAILAVILWSLAINGFIYHRAMNLHISLGIGIAMFVFIFSIAITQTALTA